MPNPSEPSKSDSSTEFNANSGTNETNTNPPNTDVPPTSAASPPNTDVPPTSAAGPPNTDVPPTSAAGPPNTDVPPTSAANSPNTAVPPTSAANPSNIVTQAANTPVFTPTGVRSLHKVLNNICSGISPDCERYMQDDIGFSNLFADIHKHDARYVVEQKHWSVFDETHWTPDDAAVMEMCKKDFRIISALLMANMSLMDKEASKTISKLTTRRSREAILKDAASVYPIRSAEFDRSPMLFNVQNGTLDLRTRTLRPHNPDDLITKVANVTYDSSAICHRWIQHILEVMDGDSETAKYLQKAIGLSLTGKNPYECFFLLYGPTTRNGKSTTMETIMKMMGDYGVTCKSDTIAQKIGSGGGPSEDIARMAGARFVNMPEPDKQMKLSSSLVKSMTGNDTITARRLYENSFEYKPAFKMFVNANHLPRVTDVSLLKSGRVKIIPFQHHFDGAQQDKTLKETLIQPHNQSGILNWALDGLDVLETEGFDEPAAVVEATAEYYHDSDKIGQFIDTCLVSTPGVNLSLESAYSAYHGWCMTNGYFAENKANFKQSLTAHAKVGRSRSVGKERLANAVSCIFDYSFADQNYQPPNGPIYIVDLSSPANDANIY